VECLPQVGKILPVPVVGTMEEIAQDDYFGWIKIQKDRGQPFIIIQGRPFRYKDAGIPEVLNLTQVEIGYQ